MKRLLIFLSVWVLLSIQGVYALYRETATSTHNVFSAAGVINISITESPLITVVPTDTPIPSITPTLVPTNVHGVSHVVINEVQTKGVTASQDFIELYNPTATQIDISGWKLRKRISTGAESSLIVIPTATTIASHRYLLWANTLNGYSSSISADLANSGSLSDNNSIALVNSSDTIIDQLSWGTGSNQFKEGLGYPDNPGISQSLERKANTDTDHNENDFVLRLIPNPKNKLSPPE